MYLIWLRLRKLAKGKPKDKRSGICGNLSDVAYMPISFVLRGSRDWPLRSNCPGFPVPYKKGNTDSDTAILAYKRAQRNNALWDFNTEYGQLRRDLCIHIMKKLEKESAVCRILAKVVGRGV